MIEILYHLPDQILLSSRLPWCIGGNSALPAVLVEAVISKYAGHLSLGQPRINVQTQCDRKRPYCSQCIRAKRDCFGYRDVSAGRFYDQTEEVRKRNSPSSSALVPSPPQKRRLDQAASPSLIQQHVSVPLAGQGAAFMLSRYPTQDRVAGGRGPVNGFPLHVLGTPAGRAVTTSLNAVGLAALSNIHQSQQLMLSARETYISALAELNEVLSDETQSISNSSLIAVGFLGMFEVRIWTAFEKGPLLI